MKYKVYISIDNNFEVEAESEEDAEEQVREFDVYKTIKHCDFVITEVEKLEEVA
jgi:hypothetical protein